MVRPMPVLTHPVAIDGAAVKAARTSAGMTLREMAGRVGCNDRYLSRIEQGRKATISRPLHAALALALGLSDPDVIVIRKTA